jgi:hypothetical protein
MNWTKASAVAEIVSSVAILVTLIYLTVQTQQNTAAIQANGRQTSLAVEQQLLNSQMENPAMWAAMHNAEYTDEQKVYFNSWLVAFFANRQADWANYRIGTLDKPAWLRMEASIRQVFKTPLFRVWWHNFSASMDPAFVARVNEIIAESPASPENNILAQWE